MIFKNNFPMNKVKSKGKELSVDVGYGPYREYTLKFRYDDKN